jgi:O-antigen/teichoic acid export membrane protein
LDNNNNIETRINLKSETFKKYFKNTSWLFTEKILRLLISFVVTVLVVRYLGPEQFGLLSYAISFYGLFSTISILGLENISIRELVKYPGRRDDILGSAFLLRLIGGIVTIILIALTLFISGEPTEISILILIISTSAIFQSFSVIDYYFRAEVKAKYSAYVMMASVLFTSLLKILLIILKAPLIYFAIVLSVEFFAMAAGFLLVYKYNKLKIINWNFREETAMNLLKDSWPLILSGLVIAIYTKIDQVMIKNMLDSKELGNYAAAVRLSEAWYFIPIALTNSLFPAIVNAKKLSNKFYLNRMQKLYDILAWIAITIAVPVSIFSGDIINIIFGSEFQSAAPVLTIYIWAGVAVFLGVASSQYLITENFTKLSFFRTLIGMVINVILNLVLIPKYGIIGAAYATLISYSVAVFSIILFPKARKQFSMMMKSILLITFIQYIFEKWNIHSEKN